MAAWAAETCRHTSINFTVTFYWNLLCLDVNIYLHFCNVQSLQIKYAQYYLKIIFLSLSVLIIWEFPDPLSSYEYRNVREVLRWKR